MFTQWRVWQMMQKENGNRFQHKQKMMLKMVLITLLQSIAVWRYFYSNGKFSCFPSAYVFFFFFNFYWHLGPNFCLLICCSPSFSLVRVQQIQLSSTGKRHRNLWMKWARNMFWLLQNLSGSRQLVLLVVSSWPIWKLIPSLSSIYFVQLSLVFVNSFIFLLQ